MPGRSRAAGCRRAVQRHRCTQGGAPRAAAAPEGGNDHIPKEPECKRKSGFKRRADERISCSCKAKGAAVPPNRFHVRTPFQIEFRRSRKSQLCHFCAGVTSTPTSKLQGAGGIWRRRKAILSQCTKLPIVHTAHGCFPGRGLRNRKKK